MAVLATELFVSCFPFVRRVAFAGLDMILLSQYGKHKMQPNRPDRKWQYLFAEDRTGAGRLFSSLPTSECIAAARELSSEDRRCIEEIARHHINLSNQRALQLLETLSIHSKTVRKKLCQDVELLDFIATRVADSALLIAFDVRQGLYEEREERRYKEPQTTVQYIRFLGSVLAEESRPWLPHIQQSDRAARFLPVIATSAREFSRVADCTRLRFTQVSGGGGETNER